MHFYFYRDKAAGRSAKMIAGVVCTMNEANTKFHSRVVFEEQGKDFKQGIVDGERFLFTLLTTDMLHLLYLKDFSTLLLEE